MYAYPAIWSAYSNMLYTGYQLRKKENKIMSFLYTYIVK
jgi:hypothetical protein